jgi:hypothetical protein
MGTAAAVPAGLGIPGIGAALGAGAEAATAAAPNMLAKGLGGIGQAAGMSAVNQGVNNMMGGDQQAAPPPPPVRPNAAPPSPIGNTAFQTPSARRPVQPSGGGQNMGGMSLQQMLEMKKRGLMG